MTAGRPTRGVYAILVTAQLVGLGLNLAGVALVLDLEERNARLRDELESTNLR